MLYRRITIYEHEHAVLFRSGRVHSTPAPGRYLLWGRTWTLVRCPRFVTWSFYGPIEAVTSDQGMVRFSVAVSTAVVDPVAFVRAGGGTTEPANWSFAGFLHQGNPATTLDVYVRDHVRRWVAAKTLVELLESAEEVRVLVPPQLAEHVSELGLEIRDMVVRDWTPVGGLRQSVADLLKAEYDGRAALARARNEAATMRSLLNTARLVRENPGLLELRALASGQRLRLALNFHTDSGGKPRETRTEEPEA